LYLKLYQEREETLYRPCVLKKDARRLSETIRIRIDLEGDLENKFNIIKENLGLKQSTEVVRTLINQKARQLAKESESQ